MLFDAAQTPLNRAGLIVIIIVIYFLSYLILSRAGKVFRYLGKTGTSVARRIMGLMLLSVAVQFIIEGIGKAFLIFK